MPSDSNRTASRRPASRVFPKLLVLAGFVLLLNALVGEKGLQAVGRARETYRQLEQTLLAAREENMRLREAARRLRQDPQVIEDIARRDLGLAKPGEKLFILRDVLTSPRQ